MFRAKYNGKPDFGGSGIRYRSDKEKPKTRVTQLKPESGGIRLDGLVLVQAADNAEDTELDRLDEMGSVPSERILGFFVPRDPQRWFPATPGHP